MLEVARRIDRGEGSTYRVNGREVRARDVQLLFADASTGANSPALVRQGQISELIAAKPQNRRLILEEAAGVSGLHGRRHEARAAGRAPPRPTCERLDDLARELEATLGRLRREARQAARYKKLAAEIRGLQGAALHARWTEARGCARRRRRRGWTRRAPKRRRAASAGRDRSGGRRSRPRPADPAAARRGDRRRRDPARLAIEKDRLDRELEGAAAELARLPARSPGLTPTRPRSAGRRGRRRRPGPPRRRELARPNGEIAAAPERLPHLEAAAAEADGERARRPTPRSRPGRRAWPRAEAEARAAATPAGGSARPAGDG